MRKIPTLFDRDWDGDRSRVLPTVTKGCEWVVAGEGRATLKYDGTCCMVRGGKLFKRREITPQQVAPPGFERIELDDVTKKCVGWVPVGDGNEDKWHREAFFNARSDFADGTYELVGPSIQGNPEGFPENRLIAHGATEFTHIPRTFEGLRDCLEGRNVEGVVFHHPDGRMAKIKGRDFGFRRP